jgi:hypothetical protein
MIHHFIHHSSGISIKDLLTLVLGAGGLAVAYEGLKTWKKSIKGTKEFETAYSLHCSVLKLRDAIMHVRNPGILPSESGEATRYASKKYESLSDTELAQGSHGYVYEMRWEEITKAYTEMESNLLAAETLWGNEILELIKPLRTKISELNIALKQHFQPEHRTLEPKDIRDVIYGGMYLEDDNTKFAVNLRKVILNVSDYLKIKMH